MINRGNDRRAVFETAGSAKAFESTLDEACERHGWGLHGYVIMRNHYHLAIETPQPNLVEGMHWLQSTFATRFNRPRSERGHLFQGRYHALLVEDWAAMARVVNYLHLNPVRARILPTAQIAAFRWSSLARFLKRPRPRWLRAGDWLAQLGLEDTAYGWKNYVEVLQSLAADRVAQEQQGFGELSRGWAIGTAGWRKAIAKDHAHLALAPGVVAKEIRKLKEANWENHLHLILQKVRKTLADATADWKGADWKITAAVKLRLAGASHRWIAEKLSMGTANSVRSYVSKRASAKIQ